MESWKHDPIDSSVAKYVDCYWFLEKTSEDVSIDRPKLNPDPAAFVILAQSQQKYLYRQGANTIEGKGSYWLLPHCKVFEMDHAEPFKMVGIKFHVDALYALNLFTPHEVLEQIISVDVRQLFRTDEFKVSDVLSDAKQNPAVCCAYLDKLVKPRLLECQDDKHYKLVHRTLTLLPDTPIGELSSALGCSQRTVERSFLKVTGFTLKQYQSMIRLESILKHLYKLNLEQIDWADIAANFAFSDQPHLIRYLKSVIGETPNEYAKRRDLTIDVYGNFE